MNNENMLHIYTVEFYPFVRKKIAGKWVCEKNVLNNITQDPKKKGLTFILL